MVEGALQVLILVFSLLFLAALISLLLKRVALPFTVVVFLVGLLLGTLAAAYWPSSAHAAAEGGLAGDLLAALHELSQLPPQFILFIFLPTLVFESAFALDARKLLANILPILVLAIPALLISTAIVGAALALGVGAEFGVTWPLALLFGALISATDPVAVVALFNELGAPPRLAVLVEGESLFNDATAIVLFNILLGIVTGTAVAASGPALLLHGSLEFLGVFFGGVGIGLILAFLFAQLISWVTNDELVEITLTTVLAYASFVVAEHYFHVSGVMSTVAAGVLLSSYGRTKISPPVQEFMHHFWKYLAYIANALIFFLVGIVIPQRVAWDDWGQYLVPMAITIVAVVVARAAGIFTLMPVVGRLTERIDLRYQSVMFWGGLRGAVALALVLAVANHPQVDEQVKSLFLTLGAAVILATLLINALTIRPLLEFLGLDRYDQTELFVRAAGMLNVLGGVRRELQRLRREESFSGPVLDRFTKDYDSRCQRLQEDLRGLTSDPDFTLEQQRSAFLAQCLAVERRSYLDLYARGELPEKTTKALQHSVDRLEDRLKAARPLPPDRYRQSWIDLALTRVLTWLEPVPVVQRWAANRKADLLADAYDTARGLYGGCRTVLRQIDHLRRAGAVAPQVAEAVERSYQDWSARAQERMANMAAQYPEYVEKVQALLAGRLCLKLELEGYRELGELDVIPEKVFHEVTREVQSRMAALRRSPRSALRFDTRDLLRQVPFFQRLPERALEELARRTRPHAVLEDETIFREGDRSDALYLIARGAVRIVLEGTERPLAVLTAGSFFGEMALLSSRPRNAGAVAAMPTHLLELSRKAVEEVAALVPELRRAMLDAYRQRLLDQSLARHPAFADLDGRQRQTLARFLRPLDLGPGQTLPDDSPRMVVVCAGSVRVNGSAVGEGELCGVEIFAEYASPAALEAITHATLLLLGPAEVEQIRAHAPAIPVVIAHRLLGGQAESSASAG